MKKNSCALCALCAHFVLWAQKITDNILMKTPLHFSAQKCLGALFATFSTFCTLCTFLVKAVHLRSMDKRCCALFNLWCTLCSLVHFMFPKTLKQAYLGNQLSVRDEPKNKLYTRRWVTICAILYDSDLLSEEVAAGSKHLAHPVLGASPIKN